MVIATARYTRKGKFQIGKLSRTIVLYPSFCAFQYLIGSLSCVFLYNIRVRYGIHYTYFLFFRFVVHHRVPLGVGYTSPRAHKNTHTHTRNDNKMNKSSFILFPNTASGKERNIKNDLA